MLYNAKNHVLKINDIEMDYVSFGKGNKNLILIAGLSLKDVKGSALALAYMYRIFAKKYKIYVFDRRREIPENYTVKSIADDTALAMNALGIESANVLGVSQGGMAAQYLALDYPGLVSKLILGVTLSRTNETVSAVIGSWLEMAERGDFRALVEDMLKKMYSDQYIKKYGFMFPFLARTSTPKNPERFIRMAKACLTCDCFDRLPEISCPVFVIGGKQDKVVSGEASEEIARRLGCKLHMYDSLGHSAYDEAKDFNQLAYDFLNAE